MMVTIPARLFGIRGRSRAIKSVQVWMTPLTKARRRSTSDARASEARALTENVPNAPLAKEIRAAKLSSLKCNFCKVCGEPMVLKVPSGEDELRHICSGCGFVDYHNPKMVVGCVVEHEGKVLLCRRALAPCVGLWTLPAGYMELHETSAEGAARETWEEVAARVDIVAPYAHLDIPIIGQAYIFFRANLAAPFTFSAGPESQEVALFAPEDIPYDSLAFSSVYVTLKRWEEDKRRGSYTLHHGVIRKKEGASPMDKGSYQFVDSYQIDLQQPVVKG